MFLRIFQHLLPNAIAWVITTAKPLREFFTGLAAAIGDPFKLYFDKVWEDQFPQTTRQLDLYEAEFALPVSSLTEQERRDRLAAAWKAIGGQDPGYIQDTLRAAGFDVYVHDWWVPGSEPAVGVLAAATARNPFTYLNDGVQAVNYVSADGNPLMQDGGPSAQDGRTSTPTGYPLVNKLLIFDPVFIGDGAPAVQDGNLSAQDGGSVSSNGNYKLKEYVLPTDVVTFPYYLYIGGVTFPNHAVIPSSRKNEFETLCLKICPAQLWLGILVDYS